MDAIKLALKTGYTHLDCAEVYGNEESVGEALKQAAIPREKLFSKPGLNVVSAPSTSRTTYEDTC